MYDKQKIGIALAGGGAKGAYQIGALKALLELDINYDCVVGTSIGALNAAAYVLKDYEKYSSSWCNMNFSFKSENEKQLNMTKYKLSEILNYLEEFEREYINSEGISPEEVIDMLKTTIDEDAVRGSKINLGITTYCLTDKKPLNLFIEDIPTGMLTEFIFASCNLPVFTPRLINGKHYLDGGVFNPLPINMLVEKGCKTIITIRLRNEAYDFGKYGNIKIIDIAPNEFLSETLSASQDRIIWMINKGYEDAIKVIKENISQCTLDI